MNVVLTTFEELLQELREQTSSSVRIVVRATIEKTDQHRALSTVEFIAGFHDERSFYELRIDCGEDLAPKRDATDKANELMRKTEAACKEMNIEFRGGKWVRA